MPDVGRIVWPLLGGAAILCAGVPRRLLALDDAARPNIPVLFAAVDDPAQAGEALQALAKCASSDEYAQAWIDVACNTNHAPEVQRELIRMVAGFGPKAGAAVPVLASLFRNPASPLREDAGVALARIGPEAVPVLLPFLRSPDPGLAVRAVYALEAMKPSPPGVLPALIDATLARDSTEALVQAAWHATDVITRDDAAIPLVVEALEQGRLRPAMSEQFVRRLGGQGAPARQAIPVLLKIASTNQDTVGAVAVESLGCLEAVATLASLVSSSNRQARFNALHALKGLGGKAKAALPQVEQALLHEDPMTRQQAILARESIRGKAP